MQHPQPHTIRPPDSTKARTTIKPDRLFLLHDGTGHRPTETIRKNHTARPPPALPAASIFRRGDQPRIGQGENHQHDHSPAPNKSGPALEADHRPRREQQPPRPRSDRLRTSSQYAPAARPVHAAPALVMGKLPGGHCPTHSKPHPDRPQISQPEPPRPRRRASEARHSIRHTARHFFKSKAHSGCFTPLVKQKNPRFAPHFQRSIVGLSLVRSRELESLAL